MKFEAAAAQPLHVQRVIFKTMANPPVAAVASSAPAGAAAVVAGGAPNWEPLAGCPREQAAWQMGMSVPPFAQCPSMARRVPHLSGLMLFESLKPVYFKNAGNKAHFDFEEYRSDGTWQWLIERHANNERDEDVTREAYGESLRKCGFCQAARSDAVFKEAAPHLNMHPHFRYSLAAATIIEALKIEQAHRASEPQIDLSLKLGVEAYDVVHNAPDDVDLWIVKDRSRSLYVCCSSNVVFSCLLGSRSVHDDR